MYHNSDKCASKASKVSMADFKPSNFNIYSKPQLKITEDYLYWKKYGVPVIFKEFGPIDFIDFSPVEPYFFAVTCSVRVQLFNPLLKEAAKSFSRFGKAAHGASFRSDGNLLCVGDDDSNVKLFDINTKSLLRVFKGHSGAVHRNFFTADKTHIASFSDDKSVILWDIPTEKPVFTFKEHNDYIRAGATSPISPDIVLSGSYDQTVKLYDLRLDKAILSVDHGSPVESVIFLPTGGIFISAGGSQVKVWDALAGGRLLAKLSQHHKTVTSLRVGSNGRRLMSASLDRHVKIYDIATYQVVHTLDYPSPVLSMGISEHDDTLAVGFTDGLISMSRRETEAKPTKRERKRAAFRSIPEDFRPTAVDVFVHEEDKKMMSKHDAFLRKFEYSKAVDSVMLAYIANKKPAIAVAVFQELIRRKGLHGALAGRETKSLIKIMRFILRNIGDHRFMRVLLDVVDVLLDVYGDSVNQSPEIALLLEKLMNRLKEEERMTVNLINLQGSIEMLVAGMESANHPQSQSTVDLIPLNESTQFDVNSIAGSQEMSNKQLIKTLS
ncbi:hypothetical protein J437_LFUL006337 [Ladona fulva]|uniref:U3 small nucleolar RNA-associated protein 15 homolog n=1 Tax=Ladona fulva TaxID=123851 RepID=A0A8K0NVM6_LADFU|nr:hypothetical protein J437_LFUL006337 [Ladona fulva]